MGGAPQLLSPWSVSWHPNHPATRCPWVVDSDIRVSYAGRQYVVQRGFRIGASDCVGAAFRPDRPGLILREWLYATHGEADGSPMSSPAVADDAVTSYGEGGDSGLFGEREWGARYCDAERVAGTSWWRSLPGRAHPQATAETPSSAGDQQDLDDEFDMLIAQRPCAQRHSPSCRCLLGILGEDDELQSLERQRDAGHAASASALQAPKFSRGVSHFLALSDDL
eukprot:m51a1_g3897 hypothetical protein (224) ;mRNA; f:87292-87963